MIHLKEITKDNLGAILKLSVYDHQKDQVATNAVKKHWTSSSNFSKPIRMPKRFGYHMFQKIKTDRKDFVAKLDLSKPVTWMMVKSL